MASHLHTAGMDVTCSPAYSSLRAAWSKICASYQYFWCDMGAAFVCGDVTLILKGFRRFHSIGMLPGSDMVVAVLPNGCRSYSRKVRARPASIAGNCEQWQTLRRGGMVADIKVFCDCSADGLIRAFAARFPDCSLPTFGFCRINVFQTTNNPRWTPTGVMVMPVAPTCSGARLVQPASWAPKRTTSCCAVC